MSSSQFYLMTAVAGAGLGLYKVWKDSVELEAPPDCALYCERKDKPKSKCTPVSGTEMDAVCSRVPGDEASNTNKCITKKKKKRGMREIKKYVLPEPEKKIVKVGVYIQPHRRKKEVPVNNILSTKTNMELVIVASEQEWNDILPRIKKDLNEINILGFDCIWTRPEGPVTLLQLATCTGFCALIRLNYMPMPCVPDSLLDILNDTNIIKLGVGCLGDKLKLHKINKINVQGCLDLRNLADSVELLTNCKKASLQGMAEEFAKFDLKRESAVTGSNWDEPVLTTKQVKYAALDAIISVDIFFAIVRKVIPQYNTLNQQEKSNSLSQLCKTSFDCEYKQKTYYAQDIPPGSQAAAAAAVAAGTMSEEKKLLKYTAVLQAQKYIPEFVKEYSTVPLNILPTTEEIAKKDNQSMEFNTMDDGGLLNQEEFDPKYKEHFERNYITLPAYKEIQEIPENVDTIYEPFNPNIVRLDGLCHRSLNQEGWDYETPMKYGPIPKKFKVKTDYFNKNKGRKLSLHCHILSPDGQLVCVVNIFCAAAYLKNRFIVRINREPMRCVMKEKNIVFQPTKLKGIQASNMAYCVVCLDTTELSERYVIPRIYHQHYPKHNREESELKLQVLLCRQCNFNSQCYDLLLRRHLGKKYHVPRPEKKVKTREEGLVVACARALVLHNAYLNDTDIAACKEVMADHFKANKITQEQLEFAGYLNKFAGEQFAYQVITRFLEEESVATFEAMWKIHFLHTMHPEYLEATFMEEITFEPQPPADTIDFDPVEEDPKKKKGDGESTSSFASSMWSRSNV